jgi:hypothetical protein
MAGRVATAIVAGMVWMAAAAGAAERSPGGGLSAALAEAGFAGRETCRRALETLPTERMMAEERQVVEHFHRGTTLHRKLPAETIRCQQSLLEFVLVKPETLVDVWRVLGISRVALDPVGPGRWRLSDGYGTAGTVRLLHHERGPAGGLLVFHGRGGYTGPLAPKPLTGGCLLVVRHEPAPGGDGSAQRVEVEAFLEVDGLGLEIVTRTLQPLIVRSAAANVHEICLFMGQFSAAASRNPGGMARLAEQLPRTGPADRRMLVTLAAGDSGTPAGQPTGAADVSEELAARWLTADDLDTIRR